MYKFNIIFEEMFFVIEFGEIIGLFIVFSAYIVDFFGVVFVYFDDMFLLLMSVFFNIESILCDFVMSGSVWVGFIVVMGDFW